MFEILHTFPWLLIMRIRMSPPKGNLMKPWSRDVLVDSWHHQKSQVTKLVGEPDLTGVAWVLLETIELDNKKMAKAGVLSLTPDAFYFNIM